MAHWYTVEEAQADWPDAPEDDDGGSTLLESLLAVAQEAVILYAPLQEGGLIATDDGYVTDGEYTITEGYRRAQLLQARNVWNSTKVSTSGNMDGDQYGLAASFPLDWQVRQLIRPKRGRPVIG